MAAIERDQKDLVLGPGSHAFVLDKSKGQISVWTGPVRVSLSNTDDTVAWNTRDRRFSPIPVVENAIQPNVVAREGEYIILENPSMSGEEHPPAGSNASAAALAMGKTMVSHGPASFALWPMQSASVVPGHILRSDQYLIVKVVDEAAARQHFDKAIIKGSGGAKDVIKLDELSTGRLFIIPGTEVNFYMPCSGIEVLKIDGAFVQDAVTVEAMEYAYLRDQSGKKRYAYGPDVVFPKPTETFVTRHLDDGSMTKTFRVIELTETSGLYIKVIEDYRDGEVDRKAGDELFITGKDHPIYRPRREHMLIKQGGSEIHYSIAIPDAGTGYYVLNKRTWTDSENNVHKDGVVELIRGPRTLLIDPRNQTLTKRALPLHLVELMYPGNQEALEVNAARLDENTKAMARGIAPAAVAYAVSGGSFNENSIETMTKGGVGSPLRRASAARGFEGETAHRPDTYRKPRAISLESSKYDGAPRMMIQPGYAVLLVNSVGARRVVKDGEVALLEYDEIPVVLALSTNTPKSGATRRKVVYLRMVTKISDRVRLETSDGVRLTLDVSYRVRFLDDAKTWFNVEDPVGLLTDNMRSRIHSGVHELGIREFYSDFAGKVRSIVLGELTDGARKGVTFGECNMHVYDVDVLQISFEDRSLESLFALAARAAFQDELKIAEEQRGLALSTKLTEVNLAKSRLAADGAEQLAAFTKQKANADAEGAIATILALVRKDEEEGKAKLARVAFSTDVARATLAERQLSNDQDHANMVRANDEGIRTQQANTNAAVAQLAAIQPGLIAALDKLGESELIEKIAGHLNVQSILGGTSVSDALAKALRGTRFASLLEEHSNRG